METKDLLEKFNAGADVYDQQRRKLIPNFDLFYGTVVDLAVGVGTPKILDIGAGTGLVSELLLRKFPQAAIVLVDLSDKMLDQARKRFSSNPRVSYIKMDYSEDLPEGPFDLVVSALSIHHLSHVDKAALMGRVFDVLKSGGRFINADQVLGPTPILEEIYYTDWVKRIEATDLTEQDRQNSYERRKLDQSALLSDQLDWLRLAGFSNFDCVYKHFFLAVFLGIKP